MKRKDRIRSRVLALVMTAAIVFTGAVFSQAGTMKAEAAGPINGSVALHSLAVGSIIGPNTTVTGNTADGDIVFQYSALGYNSVDLSSSITYSRLKTAYENENRWDPAKGISGSYYVSNVDAFKVVDVNKEANPYWTFKVVGISDAGSGSGSNTSSGSGCDHTYEWTEEQAATADKDAVLAYKCTKCGHIAAYQNEANSAYFSFINDAVNKIKKAPQGGTVTIDTGNWISINKSFMEQLAKRPDVTFVIKFTDQKHVRRELVINPGTDYSKFVDSNGYYGFLYMLGVLNETGYPAAK